MKTTTTRKAILSLFICLLVSNLLVSCKAEVAVTGLDDVADTIGDAINSNNDSGDEESVGFEGTAEDDDETAGGVQIMAPDGYDSNSESYFLGTYSIGTNSGNYYSDYSQRCDADYNFPSVIRGYSHNTDEFIDFESNSGELVWIADTFEDETFDFSVRFLNVYGKPTVQLNCTCDIAEGYGDYYQDEIQCDCDGSDSCSLYYTKKK